VPVTTSSWCPTTLSTAPQPEPLFNKCWTSCSDRCKPSTANLPKPRPSVFRLQPRRRVRRPVRRSRWMVTTQRLPKKDIVPVKKPQRRLTRHQRQRLPRRLPRHPRQLRGRRVVAPCTPAWRRSSALQRRAPQVAARLPGLVPEPALARTPVRHLRLLLLPKCRPLHRHHPRRSVHLCTVTRSCCSGRCTGCP